MAAFSFARGNPVEEHLTGYLPVQSCSLSQCDLFLFDINMSTPPKFVLNNKIGSPEEEDLYSLLAKKFSRVLLYCHPSTFFSPDDMQVEDKEACFLGEITFAILNKNKYGPLVFCVIPKNGQYADSVRQILAQQKVAIVQGDLPSDYEHVKRACEDLINDPPTPIVIKRGRISEGENWIRVRMEKKLRERANFLREIGIESEEYQFLHEFPLRRVISLNPWLGHPRPTKVLEGHDKKCEYLKRARFDVLLTSGFPGAFPLMAAEFQGPDHEKNSNKLRDKLKAELCRDVGLPLLIATYSDIPRGDNNLVPELRENSRMFQECFEFALISILGLRDTERRERIEVDAHYAEVFKQVQEKIKKLENKSNATLTKEQRLKIYFDTDFNLYAERPIPFSLEDEIEMEARRDEEAEEWYRQEITKRGGLLSSITYNDNDASGGIRAGAELQLKNNESDRVSLLSPRVYLDGQSVAGHSMKSICNSFVRNWILRTAYKKLESPITKVIAIKREN